MNNPAFPCYWYDFSATGEQVVRQSFPGITELDYFAGIAFGKILEASLSANSRLSGISIDQVVEKSFDYARSFLKYREGLEDYLAKGGTL